MSWLWSHILLKSTLAVAIKDIYDNIANNDIATVRLGTTSPLDLSLHVPLPPFLSSLPARNEASMPGLLVTSANPLLDDEGNVDAGNLIGSAAYNSLVDGITGTGSHDKLVFNGTAGSTLTFSGNLTVIASGYTPRAGDVFNLFDWALLVLPDFSGFNVGTNFRDGSGDDGSQFDLPDLTGTPGLAWDVSRFTTSGNIVVVPEPGRMLLLCLGALGLLMRRRRRFKACHCTSRGYSSDK